MRDRQRLERRQREFRERVLEVANALFEEQGIEATKLDEIAEAADVAKRTLSNHFPTKAHIVQALSGEAVSRMVAMIDGATQTGRTTQERLAHLFDSLSDGASSRERQHRESVLAFFHAAHGTPNAADDEIRLSDALLKLLTAAPAAPLPGDCEPGTFAELVLGSIYSTSLEWAHRDDYDFEAQLRKMSKLFQAMFPE